MGWAGGHPWSEDVWLTQEVPTQREALMEMCLALMEMSGTDGNVWQTLLEQEVIPELWAALPGAPAE